MSITLGLPAPVTLAATLAMSHGARNWPFFTLTDTPGLRRGDQQISLATEEGRDLEDIDNLSHRGALVRLVDIGDDGQAEAFPDLGEDRQCRCEPDPAPAPDRGAVRLVEGGLVDESDTEAAPQSP